MHAEVAKWYGYEHPDHMQGLYVSQLHDHTCLTQVRRYAVARQLGLAGVPETYDMRIHLPNGQHRWLRKQQVRQLDDRGDIYWITQSIPVSAAEAKPPSEIALPLPISELERLLRWGDGGGC